METNWWLNGADEVGARVECRLESGPALATLVTTLDVAIALGAFGRE